MVPSGKNGSKSQFRTSQNPTIISYPKTTSASKPLMHKTQFSASKHKIEISYARRYVPASQVLKFEFKRHKRRSSVKKQTKTNFIIAFNLHFFLTRDLAIEPENQSAN